MDDDLWLGLDLGTQSARALAVTSDGRIVTSASRPLSGPQTAWPAGSGRRGEIGVLAGPPAAGRGAPGGGAEHADG